MQNLSSQISFLGLCVLGTSWHITLEYFPRDATDEHILEVIRSAPIGKAYQIKATRFGEWEDRNKGYRVELPKELETLFKGHIPHITTYVKSGCQAVDTWKAFTGLGKSKKVNNTFTCVLTYYYRDGSYNRTSVLL